MQLELEGGDVRYDPGRTAWVAVESASVTFRCRYLVDPMPMMVAWQINEVIIDTDDSKYTVTNSCVDMGSVSNCTAQLTVTDVVREDSGLYTCNPSNIHGSAQASDNFTVIGKKSVVAMWEL